MNCSLSQVKSIVYKFVFISVFFTGLTAFALASYPENVVIDSSVTETEHSEGLHNAFNPGKLVMEHISDSHEWHLWGSHEHPVSIPLPVIIFNKEKGLSCFLSSRFEHGHASYEGYKLEEGTIISEDGSKFYDLSITKNVFAMFIAVAIILIVFISVAKSYVRNKDSAPTGLQNAIEPIIMFVRDDIAKAAIGEKHHARFMPYLLTIFFFIWINNLLGLIPIFPGGANVTGNIAVPLVMALFTLAITLYNGNKNYWRHIFAMPGVPFYVLPIITLLEVLGIFLKPFVLMVRLFANIMAGHIVILVFFCLIFVAGQASTGAGLGTAIPAVAFTIFINALELLVGFLQAFVFTFLSAIYFGMALVEHEHKHEHH
ncbi:MAG: F0F1 ATP synthase subunit A [Bacteroidia bacterium]